MSDIPEPVESSSMAQQPSQPWGAPVAPYAQASYAPPGAWQPGMPPAAPRRPLGKDRSPAAILGLSIITLGIYFLVWYGSLNAEIRRHDPSVKVVPALSVLACFVPIANIVSYYSTAARLRQMQLDCGQTETISPVVALLLVVFLGIGYPLYLASQTREHWHRHARQGF